MILATPTPLDPPFQLQFRALSGHHGTLDGVRGGDLASDVLCRIAAKLGLRDEAAGRLRLVRAGKQLEPEAACGLAAGDTVHMVGGLAGGHPTTRKRPPPAFGLSDRMLKQRSICGRPPQQHEAGAVCNRPASPLAIGALSPPPQPLAPTAARQAMQSIRYGKRGELRGQFEANDRAVAQHWEDAFADVQADVRIGGDAYVKATEFHVPCPMPLAMTPLADAAAMSETGVSVEAGVTGEGGGVKVEAAGVKDEADVKSATAPSSPASFHIKKHCDSSRPTAAFGPTAISATSITVPRGGLNAWRGWQWVMAAATDATAASALDLPAPVLASSGSPRFSPRRLRTSSLTTRAKPACGLAPSMVTALGRSMSTIQLPPFRPQSPQSSSPPATRATDTSKQAVLATASVTASDTSKHISASASVTLGPVLLAPPVTPRLRELIFQTLDASTVCPAADEVPALAEYECPDASAVASSEASTALSGTEASIDAAAIADMRLQLARLDAKLDTELTRQRSLDTELSTAASELAAIATTSINAIAASKPASVTASKHTASELAAMASAFATLASATASASRPTTLTIPVSTSIVKWQPRCLKVWQGWRRSVKLAVLATASVAASKPTTLAAKWLACAGVACAGVACDEDVLATAARDPPQPSDVPLQAPAPSSPPLQDAPRDSFQVQFRALSGHHGTLDGVRGGDLASDVLCRIAAKLGLSEAAAGHLWLVRSGRPLAPAAPCGLAAGDTVHVVGGLKGGLTGDIAAGASRDDEPSETETSGMELDEPASPSGGRSLESAGGAKRLRAAQRVSAAARCVAAAAQSVLAAAQRMQEAADHVGHLAENHQCPATLMEPSETPPSSPERSAAPSSSAPQFEPWADVDGMWLAHRTYDRPTGGNGVLYALGVPVSADARLRAGAQVRFTLVPGGPPTPRTFTLTEDAGRDECYRFPLAIHPMAAVGEILVGGMQVRSAAPLQPGGPSSPQRLQSSSPPAKPPRRVRMRLRGAGPQRRAPPADGDDDVSGSDAPGPVSCPPLQAATTCLTLTGMWEDVIRVNGVARADLETRTAKRRRLDAEEVERRSQRRRQERGDRSLGGDCSSGDADRSGLAEDEVLPERSQQRYPGVVWAVRCPQRCSYCTRAAPRCNDVAQIDGPVLHFCHRCFGLYEPHIEWLRENAGVDSDTIIGVDYAGLEWAAEEVSAQMARAVRLSRLFKGVAWAAGRLVLAQRRAAARVYAPGREGYAEAARGFHATALRQRRGGDDGLNGSGSLATALRQRDAVPGGAGAFPHFEFKHPCLWYHSRFEWPVCVQRETLRMLHQAMGRSPSSCPVICPSRYGAASTDLHPPGALMITTFLIGLLSSVAPPADPCVVNRNESISLG